VTASTAFKKEEVQKRNAMRKPRNAVIVGHLNKLNESNYDRIRDAMAATLAGDDTAGAWEEFMGVLLQKCCTQHFFVDVYVRLMRDLMQRVEVASASVRSRRSVRYFEHAFLQDLQKPARRSSPEQQPQSRHSGHSEQERYDAFCAANKGRDRSLGANKLVLRLIVSPLDPDAVTDAVIAQKQYADALSDSFSTEADATEEACELRVEFLIEMMNVLGTGSEHVRRCYEAARSNPTVASHGRCKLRLMDISDKLLGVAPPTTRKGAALGVAPPATRREKEKSGRSERTKESGHQPNTVTERWWRRK